VCTDVTQLNVPRGFTDYAAEGRDLYAEISIVDTGTKIDRIIIQDLVKYPDMSDMVRPITASEKVEE